ncbi:citrate synthase [Telmatospirillum sp.]|uniref:citrate synthase n=1 Tax=Telmatospirillum sp. TaxID=2079197 RepID=UPI00284E0161|nr:citrate synthase [Telmatospirillum sp.]MDR3439405.1 citrate synthase [Telmatospirillum sp.]
MSEKNSQNIAKLIIGDRSIDLTVMIDSFDRPAVDIRNLFAKYGVMTFDPGYTSTASCQSAITYIDGNKGVLLYRGYPIEQLAADGSYLEAAYLLLNGELPNRRQFEQFQRETLHRMPVHEQMIEILRRYKRDTHPMVLIESMVTALGAFDTDCDVTTREGRNRVAINLIAKIPTITALALRYIQGKPFIYPREDLGYTENFIRMCFAPSDGAPFEINPIIAGALDRIFILHADHEQNASTSTVRLAGSTGVEPYAAISAGIVALWGAAHGGANEAVLGMLERIGSKDAIPAFLEQVKDKESHDRLMGFGHRVYKNYDPRALIIKKESEKVLANLDVQTEQLDVAKELERIALQDPYFTSRQLYPNVDFYSGITLSAMGFPVHMFTPLFALARTSGWIAQWKEMVDGGPLTIGRPRQHYTGPTQRDYVALDKRD